MRRIIKKSVLKGYPKLIGQTQTINTNLEKKTQEKINAMSTGNDSLTMDFVLKNRKLLEHLKKCKVFLSKSMRKNLLTKYAAPKSTLKEQRKKKTVKNIARGRGRPRKETKLLPDSNGIVTNLSLNVSTTTPGSSNLSKKSPSQPSKSSKKDCPPDVPKVGRIFIRLPTTPSKRSIQKRHLFDKIVGRTNLIKQFGKKIFNCHVRVRRLNKSDPLFVKKFKKHRKTVSFMETVEIFGESDIEYDESASSPEPACPDESTTSTPVTKNRGRKLENSKQKLTKSPVSPKSPRISLTKTDSHQSTPSPKKQLTTKLKQATPNEKGASNKSPRLPKRQLTPKPKKATPKTKQDKMTPQSEKKQRKSQPGSPKKNQTQQRSPKKADSLQTSPKKANTPKKSPIKNQEAALQLSLNEGKQCFVRLNRNSTELMNLSATSNGATEPSDSNNEINGTECTQAAEEDVLMENVDDVNTSNVCDKLTDEDNIGHTSLDDNMDEVENADVQEQTEDDNNENIEPTLEDEDVPEEKDSVHEEEEIVASNDLVYSEELSGLDNDPKNREESDIGVGPLDENIITDEEDEDPDEESDLERIWNEAESNKFENLTTSSGAESFHTTLDNKQSDEVYMDKDQAPSETNNPESRTSTPTQHFDTLPDLGGQEPERMRLSPMFSNGASENDRIPSVLPNAEDLFDMLKSNKLPGSSSPPRRVPSPTQGLTDDEDDDIIPNPETSQNYNLPVSDLLDESDLTNDSRFSLNTFFKSVKDKFMAKRAENGSPSRSSPRHDDLNLSNQDRNLDSPATHEITTQ